MSTAWVSAPTRRRPLPLAGLVGLAVLSLGVVVAALAAAASGASGTVGGPQVAPVEAAGPTVSSQHDDASLSATAPVEVAAAGSAAPAQDEAQDGAPTAAAGVEEDAASGFTLAELAAGEVTPAAFAAFWEAELDRIRTAPCPAAPAQAGTTVVVISAGATPPAHLGDAYTDYEPLLAAARAEAAAACR